MFPKIVVQVAHDAGNNPLDDNINGNGDGEDNDKNDSGGWTMVPVSDGKWTRRSPDPDTKETNETGSYMLNTVHQTYSPISNLINY